MSRPTKQTSKAYFPCLDAIRTFACFFPISTHLFWERFSPRFVDNPSLQGWPVELLAFLFGNGSFGVRLFMVMSGFLITYLMFQELEVTKGFSVYRFYMRRVLRIWPVYFAVIGYIFLIYPLAKSLFSIHTPIHENPWMYLFFLGNFEFIRTLSQPGIYPNSQISLTWSVGIEEQFYLLWPLLFALARTRGILAGAVGFWLLSLASHIHFHSDPILWPHHTAPCFLYIASGALLGWAFYHHRDAIDSGLGRIPYPAIVALTLVFFFLLFRLGVAAFETTALLPLFGVFTAFFCCWLMASQIVHQSHPWNMCHFQPMVNFSKYTYGLYMYHRIIQWWLAQLLFRSGLIQESTPLVDAGVNLATLLGGGLAAYVSYHTFEAYFNRRKHLYSPFRSTTRVEVAPHPPNEKAPSGD